MYSSLKHKLSRHYQNSKGWKTNRKLLVIESDDWGSIRTSNKSALQRFSEAGLPIHKDPYTLYDSLESNQDLEKLFNLLSEFKDKNGEHLKFTINNIVANPDFDKIREGEFQKYYYENFTTTLNKYPNSDNVLSLYQKAKSEKLITIQFHGREHLHVNNWMLKLNKSDKFSLLAFENQMFTYFPKIGANCFDQNLDAFANNSFQDFDFISESIKDGVKIFNEIWGNHPQSVVAPCHIWNPELAKTFQDTGILHIQSDIMQTHQNGFSQEKKQTRHFTGEYDPIFNLLYTTRNVSFEPSLNSDNIINRALKEIEIAFTWKKPAIISTHRLNYVGRLNKQQRDNNLLILKKLIQKITKKWPNIEFITVDQLYKLISKDILNF